MEVPHVYRSPRAHGSCPGPALRAPSASAPLSPSPDTQLPSWLMNTTAFQVSRPEWVREELGVWGLSAASLIKLKSSPSACEGDSGVPGLRGVPAGLPLPFSPSSPRSQGPSANSRLPPHRGGQGRAWRRGDGGAAVRSPRIPDQAFVSKQMFLITHPAHEGQKQLGVWQRPEGRLTTSLLSSHPSQTVGPSPNRHLSCPNPRTRVRRMDVT